MAKPLAWLGFGAILATLAWRLPAAAQLTGPLPQTDLAAPASGWIAHFETTAGGGVDLTLVDPARQVIAVYRVARETGEIELLSLRNIRWDFQLSHHNSGKPLPAEIRKMVEQIQ